VYSVMMLHSGRIVPYGSTAHTEIYNNRGCVSGWRAFSSVSLCECVIIKVVEACFAPRMWVWVFRRASLQVAWPCFVPCVCDCTYR
jgi:hypothetical protein